MRAGATSQWSDDTSFEYASGTFDEGVGAADVERALRPNKLDSFDRSIPEA
jgi:hypothetical protein